MAVGVIMSAVASTENTKVCSCLVVNGAPKRIENKYDTPTASTVETINCSAQNIGLTFGLI